MKSAKLYVLILVLLSLGLSGCEVIPVTRYKPTLHNPFVGNMRSVAVVPFYNLTNNPRVDGREFASHFALELQRVPGFNVIANKTVEDTMLEHGIHRFESVNDIRYLAELLKVDAVIIGKIHHFDMANPPMTKFDTAWYSVNPYLHPMMEGYGLPWGTEYEHFIPDKIVLLAEMNLAEAQIKTQTPRFEPIRRDTNGTNGSGDGNEESDTDSFFRLDPPRLAIQPGEIRQMSATQMAASIPNNLRVESTDTDQLFDMASRQTTLAMNRHLASTGVPYVPEAPAETDKERREMLFRSSLDHPLKQGPWKSETAKENQLPWSEQNVYPQYQQGMHNSGGFAGHYSGHHPVPGDRLNETPSGQLTEYGWVAQPIMPLAPQYLLMPGIPIEGHSDWVMGEPNRFLGLPADWPDPRGFIPEGPQPERQTGQEKNEGPIISWVNVYKGNDSEFMQALQDYDMLFQDDRRLNSKQSILTNRNEFISFCCRMHIWEIFSARGGAGPAQKVIRAWKPWKGGERPY